MPNTTYRTRKFGESMIRRVTRLANECSAINPSQRYPDFDPPEVVMQAAAPGARLLFQRTSGITFEKYSATAGQQEETPITD